MPEQVLSVSALMTSDMANAGGFIHGGRLMQLLDNVAYACASRYSRCNVVTAAVNELSFDAPLRVGDLVTVWAEVRSIGRTSMFVALRLEAEHIRGGERRTTGGGTFRMVALDDSGQPVPVPPLVPGPIADEPA
jgi:acyl-CoA hydrolase